MIMKTQKEKDFDKLKMDYLKSDKECHRLIEEIQKNLIDRGAYEGMICLDEKAHSVRSYQTDDLFAIDGMLRFQKNKNDNGKMCSDGT